MINENYYKGWSSNVGQAMSYNGLISVQVSPSDSGKEVTFRFTSKAFSIGLIVSILSIIAAILVFWKPGKIAAAAAPVAKAINKLESYVFRQ